MVTYAGNSNEPEGAWSLVEAADPDQRFERIVLGRNMLQDHMAGTYIEGLRNVLEQLEREEADQK